MPCSVNAIVFAIALLCAGGAQATTVYVISLTNSRAQMIINGGSVVTLAPGQTSPEGVMLESISGNAANLIVDGRRISLGLGRATTSETSLKADANGHYFATAYINSAPVRAQIDTGATYVTLNGEDAARLGIDYRRGRQMISRTANGAVNGYIVNLPRVQVGDVALTNVPGVVLPGGRDQLSHALIGMSFLRHVEMRRSGDTMVLLKAND
jgi:aspartyl protease family protein